MNRQTSPSFMLMASLEKPAFLLIWKRICSHYSEQFSGPFLHPLWIWMHHFRCLSPTWVMMITGVLLRSEGYLREKLTATSCLPESQLTVKYCQKKLDTCMYTRVWIRLKWIMQKPVILSPLPGWKGFPLEKPLRILNSRLRYRPSGWRNPPSG